MAIVIRGAPPPSRCRSVLEACAIGLLAAGVGVAIDQLQRRHALPFVAPWIAESTPVAALVGALVVLGLRDTQRDRRVAHVELHADEVVCIQPTRREVPFARIRGGGGE